MVVGWTKIRDETGPGAGLGSSLISDLRILDLRSQMSDILDLRILDLRISESSQLGLETDSH